MSTIKYTTERNEKAKIYVNYFEFILLISLLYKIINSISQLIDTKTGNEIKKPFAPGELWTKGVCFTVSISYITVPCESNKDKNHTIKPTK